MVDPNTRQGKRTPVTLKIKFKSETLDQFIERYAVDVSQGGIFIRTKEPLAVGTQMKFEFQLRDASPLIAGEGTVVWTRENDPSRPAIAPGMGVRFDRLADGSQAILERILAEKAKQAPQRPAIDTAKPPMFTDTPTRVAPTHMQDALLGKDNGRSRRVSDDPGGGDSLTPLPKPMPFHSDADEFPDEAFEEATKVRALDELIAQTADAGQGTDEQGRRGNGRNEAGAGGAISDRAETLTEPIEASLARRERINPSGRPAPARPDGTKPQAEIYEAPDLPNPPELATRPPSRLLDTSPSPRIETGQPGFVPESITRTRPGVEPARGRTSSAPPVAMHEPAHLPHPPSTPPPQIAPAIPRTLSAPLGQLEASPLQAPPLHGLPPHLVASSSVRAVATEHTEPARMPALRTRSNSPILILVLLGVAVGAAAVWFFVLRPRATEHSDITTAPTTPDGSAVASGSAVAALGSAGPAGPAGSSSPASPESPAVPAATGSASTAHAELVDTIIGSTADHAQIEIKGGDQTGPAPFTARLEKGKPYEVRVSAPGFAALELTVKGGDDHPVAKLVAKPRVISVMSEPPGALILVDGVATGRTTPSDVELTATQAARKTVRVQLRKGGFRPIERVVDIARLTEDDIRMVTTLDEKLAAQPATANRPPQPKPPAPAAGSDDTGSATDSSSPPASGSAQDSAAPTPAPAAAGSGSGSAAEPEPDFNKQN